MGLPFAVSFEGRLQRDRMALILKLEVLTIFSTALAVVFLTGQHFFVKLFFTIPTALSVFLVVKDRLEKTGRKLKRAVVKSVRHRGNDWFFFLPMTPSFSFTANGFEVEAVSEDMTLVKFLDCRPWKVGQKLLVLSDIKGKVLAVRDMKLPIRIDMLKKLA
ncbi:MAG: hypothetical protein QXU87_09750 [Candidatus Caldarchaeum sp.]|uniref:Uncharacterized protein n=1 Tax=Caldiarchaeum subterraneum TaxID=311458 RepID=A0A7C5L6Y4_CALS0